ncbi:hypothetical protein BS78_K149900 [Paspalum vaginatum]|uniref:Uncharacterized protein n=1 Tax=Paspalum vaginatum TaxID=158149 RepID=A0A9W7XB28_9POAL|nr:hypothetical protein BS78_K149900 [Paspalum vaginatum]
MVRGGRDLRRRAMQTQAVERQKHLPRGDRVAALLGLGAASYLRRLAFPAASVRLGKAKRRRRRHHASYSTSRRESVGRQEC